MFNHYAIPQHTSIKLVCSDIMVVFTYSEYKIDVLSSNLQFSSRISKSKYHEFSILIWLRRTQICNILYVSGIKLSVRKVCFLILLRPLSLALARLRISTDNSLRTPCSENSMIWMWPSYSFQRCIDSKILKQNDEMTSQDTLLPL